MGSEDVPVYLELRHWLISCKRITTKNQVTSQKYLRLLDEGGCLCGRKLGMALPLTERS